MAVTALSNTTLSAALDASTNRFAVASTTGINGLGSLTTPQSILVVDGEAMAVLNVPVPGMVEVTRGYGGTRARAHANASKVYFGAKTVFGFAQTGGSLPEGIIGLAGSPGVLPDYRLPVGVRARDAIGNEYVLCDLTGDVFGGTPVQINADFTAAKVGITGRGAFGVAAEPGTSDQWAWVQIYGKCMIQLLGATAEVSPSDAANGPTTLSTTAQTKFWLPTTATSTGPEGIRWTSGSTSLSSGFYVEGLTVAQDAAPASVSSVTAATSHTGSQISVFLNYPRIVHVNYGE
jgi:hypothetical protein